MAVNLLGSGNALVALPSVTTLGGLTEFACCITVNISSIANGERIVGQWGSAGRSFLVTIQDTDEVAFTVAGSDASANFFGVKTTVTNLTSGLYRFGFRWRAQAGADDCEIWINGSQPTTTAWFSGTLASMQSVTDDIEIGHEVESVIDGVDGDYSEFAAWGSYLTSDIMQALTKGFSPGFYDANRLHYVKMINTGSLVDLDGNSSPTNSSGTDAQHPPMFYPAPGKIGKAITASGVTIAVPSANTVTLQAGTPSISAAAGATVISPVATVSFGAQTPRAKGGASVRPAAASVLLSNAAPSIVAKSPATIVAAAPSILISPQTPTIDASLPAGFNPHAVEFDGSAYLTRGADLTGTSDGKLLTVSGWLNSSSATGQTIVINNLFSVDVTLIGSGVIRIRGENAAGTTILSVSSSAGYSDGEWHHYAGSFDLANASNRHLYVNDISDLATVATYTDDSIDFTASDWSVGASPSGTAPVIGCLGEIWVDDSYIDLSVEANRRKFYSASGTPVDLGSDGSTPTGSAPLIYLGGDGQFASGWETNKGSGGGFTENGTLLNCATDLPGSTGSASVLAASVGISILPQTATVVAQQLATVAATHNTILLNAGTPAISAINEVTVFPDVALLQFEVLDVFIDATKEFKTAGVSVWEGVSFPEGVTDTRMTVGQAGVNDEAEEES